MKTDEQSRAWFTFLLGFPAILAWIVYVLAWLLGPRFPELPDPIICAGYAAGAYYSIIAFIFIGPVFL